MALVSEPFLLWHYNYAASNFYHFLIEAMPALIVGLRALNGSLRVVTVMAHERQLGIAEVKAKVEFCWTNDV